MSSLANLSPAATYADILQIANDGLGLNTTPSQIQDGLGNRTIMTISSDFLNMDRGVGEFQLDGVALTATAAQLNNLTDISTATYLVQTATPSLPNSLVIQTSPGILATPAAGNITFAPGGQLAGLQALNTTGFMVLTAGTNYATRTIVTDGSISLTNGDGIAGNPSLGVIADTTVQKVNVKLNTVTTSTRSNLNFIPGPNIGINVIDNIGTLSSDITISGEFQTLIRFKTACYAGTVATLNATYVNGAAGIGATLTNAGALAAFAVDGVSPPITSRILVKDQTNPVQNGIYTLTTVGSGAAAWVLTRATDYDSAAEIGPGDFTTTLNGTVNALLGWVQTDVVVNIGSDPIEWNQFGSTNAVTQVNGTAGQIVVVNPTTTPTISIDPTYVGQASITTLGTITTGVWNGTALTVPYGGTGLTTLTTAYGVVCAGTTATGALQNAGTGTSGQILQSNGAGFLPSWVNASTSVLSQIVSQAGHGFAVGDVIRCVGLNNFTKAQANSAANAEVIGIVCSVVSANIFRYQFAGEVTTGGAVVPGTVYFLDPVTAGAITATAPTTPGQILKPILIATFVTSGIWLNYIGQQL